MVVLVEIFNDNGPAHYPDFKFIAIAGDEETINTKLIEIIEGLSNCQRISSVSMGDTSTSMWVDTRYFM